MPKKLTNEDFIEKARRVHGDRYEYDKALYIGSLEKVTITCPIHGDFEQLAGNHLRGRGCANCHSDSQRSDTETFVKRAVDVHGQKYSYNKVVYSGAFKKVTITCPVHGDFEQLAGNHLSGRGCVKCRNDSKRSDTETFVKRAVEVHGDKYLYTGVVYKGVQDKVTITCPVHGDFEQRPEYHLRSNGCPKCYADSRRSDTETFVKRAVEVHGGKYEYSKAVYTDALEKITITCPVHGDFDQTPATHLRGGGCSKCRDDSQRSDTETFVKRAVEVHGDKYLYTGVVYKGAFKKVTITCPIHGDFEQLANNHLSGRGCAKCTDHWSGDGVVYVICSPEGYNKIGIAKSGTEHGRLQQILKSQQTKSPTAITGLSLVCAYSFTDGSFTEAKRFEGKAHRHFKARRKVFPDKFDGSCEFFTVPVSEICSYLEQQGGKLVTIKNA